MMVKPSVTELLKKVDNRYTLAVMASKRARQIAAGDPDMKTTSFPSMEEVGSKQNTEYVKNMGETIGNDIKKLGFT